MCIIFITVLQCHVLVGILRFQDSCLGDMHHPSKHQCRAKTTPLLQQHFLISLDSKWKTVHLTFPQQSKALAGRGTPSQYQAGGVNIVTHQCGKASFFIIIFFYQTFPLTLCHRQPNPLTGTQYLGTQYLDLY